MMCSATAMVCAHLVLSSVSGVLPPDTLHNLLVASKLRGTR